MKQVLVNGIVAENIARWDGHEFHALTHGQGLAGDNPWTMASFDDGGGPAIYLAGYIDAGGDVPVDGFARWNGATWENVAAGVLPYVLAAHDDHDGPHLYVGGDFTRIGGVDANCVARYDGRQWQSLDFPRPDDSTRDAESISVIEFFDDGGGEALYVAGRFRTLGGQAFNSIARRVGATWQPMSSGFSNPNESYNVVIVTDLQVFDDGTGPALYACGWFRDSGATRVNGIARWDGQQWQPLGSGLTYQTAVHPFPYAMAVHDDGGGPALYVAGQFDRAGGQPVPSIARWNGVAWSLVGNITFTTFPPVFDSALSFDVGDGPALYVGTNAIRVNGVDLRGLVRWKDGGWSEFAGGIRGSAYVIVGRQEADGPALYAGGYFGEVGPVAAPIVSARFARYGCISTVIRGDLNCDGLVNVYDIDAFVLALQDAAAYTASFPNCHLENADTNGDGAVNAFDIDPFVELLVNSGG